MGFKDFKYEGIEGHNKGHEGHHMISFDIMCYISYAAGARSKKLVGIQNR